MWENRDRFPERRVHVPKTGMKEEIENEEQEI